MVVDPIKTCLTRFMSRVPNRPGCSWSVSCHNPGDGKRWQIVEINDDNVQTGRSFPHAGHVMTGRMRILIDGALELHDLIER